MDSNSKQESLPGKRGGRWASGKRRYQRGFKSNNNFYNNNNRSYNPNYYPYSQNNLIYPYTQYPSYIQQQILYRAEIYIYSRYHNLIDINSKNASLSEKLNVNSRFFVIKSFSEEDVHKSIKYGVWSSSKNGNLTLNDAFNSSHEKGGEVYLFFSCNGSGRYTGLARMKSICDLNKSFELWTQDGKWMGLFEVEWLFIKDVPFKEFKNINITLKDGEVKPVSYSRDTQEIPFEQAKIMVEKIDKYQNSNTILEYFEFYDMRQENYEKNMKMNNNNFQNQQPLNQNNNNLQHNANISNENNNNVINTENEIKNEEKNEIKENKK